MEDRTRVHDSGERHKPNMTDRAEVTSRACDLGRQRAAKKRPNNQLKLGDIIAKLIQEYRMTNVFKWIRGGESASMYSRRQM